MLANPPNPPEILPTAGGAVDLPNAEPEDGVEGFPNAEAPNAGAPNAPGEAVVLAGGGLENALGVDEGVVDAAGLEGVGATNEPKDEAEPNAVAGLMKELVALGAGLAVVEVVALGVGGGESSSSSS